MYFVSLLVFYILIHPVDRNLTLNYFWSVKNAPQNFHGFKIEK
jgi:hypothetical protein